MTDLNATHDPARRSWVESANAPGHDFPIQNLPWGVFSEGDGAKRVGVAIGDMILDVTAAESVGFLAPSDTPVFEGGTLNAFMALGQPAWSRTRAVLTDLLDAANGRHDQLVLIPRAAATMHLPVFVRSFTDFYASKEHATNVGTMFRDPGNALLPNWQHIPVGYNGRASTVVVSGTPIRRPLGQLKAPADSAPRLSPTAKLDLELELGAVVGTPSRMGQSISTAQARKMISAMCC